MADDEDEPGGDPLESERIVELATTDELDLHGFAPRDVREVVVGYLDAAWREGLTHLRIVHGRGVGVQRELVRSLLARDPRVDSYSDAPGERGGWGATLVTFKAR